MVELTRENYLATVGATNVVVIDFWAQWCAPCQQFAPIFEALSHAYPDITFAKLNADVELAVASMFSVKNLPTTIVLKKEKVLFKRVGLLSKEELDELLQKATVSEV